MIIYFYSGSSMAGTFHTGDVLFLSGTRIPRVGDVVVFNSAILVSPVVHRVIAQLPGNQYRTQGDGNRQVDAEIVDLHQIHGVVIEKQTRRQRVTVRGGSGGLIRGCIIRFYGVFLEMTVRAIRPLYVMLRRTEWTARLFHPRIFRTLFILENRPVIKLIWRSKTAGIIDQRSGFQGNPPYDLLIRNSAKHWDENHF